MADLIRGTTPSYIVDFTDSGVSSAMQGELFGSDGLHPVAKWRGYIARYVASKIKQSYIQRP